MKPQSGCASGVGNYLHLRGAGYTRVCAATGASDLDDACARNLNESNRRLARFRCIYTHTNRTQCLIFEVELQNVPAT